jgi:hypothetical protein
MATVFLSIAGRLRTTPQLNITAAPIPTVSLKSMHIAIAPESSTSMATRVRWVICFVA